MDPGLKNNTKNKVLVYGPICVPLHTNTHANAHTQSGDLVSYFLPRRFYHQAQLLSVTRRESGSFISFTSSTIICPVDPLGRAAAAIVNAPASLMAAK